MELSWLLLLLSFVVSAIIGRILIQQILRVAFSRKLFDEPDARKIHTQPIPRLGGLAFAPTTFFSVTLIVVLNRVLGWFPAMVGDHGDYTIIGGAVCGGVLLYWLGAVDDLSGVRYRAKFVVQLLAGVLLMVGGLRITNLHGILWIYELPLWASIGLTLFFIVLVINAFNMIDGIDGLASGLCAIALLCFGVLFAMMGYSLFALVAFATLGMLVQFFHFNVFGRAEHKRKIFMGDTGSLTIGYLLAFLSIRLLQLPEQTWVTPHYNTALLAFSPLAIPCLDVARVFFVRLFAGRSPFLPDKSHIHHKLLSAGLSSRQALLVILLLSALVIVGNVLASRYITISPNYIFMVDFALYLVLNIWLTHRINRRHTAHKE